MLKFNDIVLHDVIFGVLHGISMEIKKGAINAFAEPSVGGKATIAKLIVHHPKNVRHADSISLIVGRKLSRAASMRS